jgi:shikimate kinase
MPSAMLYREAATYVIETGRPTVQTLVNMIMMQLRWRPPAAPASPSEALSKQ